MVKEYERQKEQTIEEFDTPAQQSDAPEENADEEASADIKELEQNIESSHSQIRRYKKKIAANKHWNKALYFEKNQAIILNGWIFSLYLDPLPNIINAKQLC